MSLRVSTPKTVIVASTPTPLPPSQDTQILTNVNGANTFSYPGYNFKGSNMFAQQSVDISAINTRNSSTGKYIGGVLVPNGNIYCIPFSANNIGIIDPYRNTFDSTTITLTSTQNYLGGVLAPNGKIYCIPSNATNVGIIDPTINTIDTRTISQTTYPDLSAGNKFWGGVLASNGKIYCAPRNVSYVGIIDPITNTFSQIPLPTQPDLSSGASGFQYATGSMGANGNIYFAPFSATKILRIRPTDNSYNFINVTANGFGSGFFYGSACGPDGNVYFFPFNSGLVARVDISSETSSTVFNSGLGSSSTGTCAGCTLGLDGRIYGIPYNSGNTTTNKMFFYDVPNSTGGVFDVSFNNTSPKWGGGVLASNGLIYMIPFDSQTVGTIKTGIPKLQPWMLAPEFNKF